MIQPTKAALREQLALAEAALVRMRKEVATVDVYGDHWREIAQRRLSPWPIRVAALVGFALGCGVMWALT